MTTVVSQWITLFGHNLFYFIWASFLPLALDDLVSGLALREARRALHPGLLAVVFGSMLFKCLTNGYDFIIPALSMPVILLSTMQCGISWPRREFLATSLMAACSDFGRGCHVRWPSLRCNSR